MDNSSLSGLDRRTLLAGAAVGVAGASLLETPAEAEDKKALQDAGIASEWVTFPNGGERIRGFLARPNRSGKFGSVILMPGIFGVSERPGDYMREITAQVAQSGLVGLCVDFYTREGGAPKTDDFTVLRQIVGKMPDHQILGDLQSGIEYLKKQPFTNGKFGITGFCMGGRYSLLLAAQSVDVSAVSPYYGPLRSGGPDRVAVMDLAERIHAAVQGHYGATDMNPKPEDVREFYTKLKQTNPHADFTIYEGAGHAFHDFSRPAYNKDAATRAWGSTLTFFQQYLGK